MNKRAMWETAGVLAARDYEIEFEKEELTDGSSVYVAVNPELPGCLAQGTTVEEAEKELEEARKVYIWSLLEDGLPVPDPKPKVVATPALSYSGTEITFTARFPKNASWQSTHSMAVNGSLIPA